MQCFRRSAIKLAVGGLGALKLVLAHRVSAAVADGTGGSVGPPSGNSLPSNASEFVKVRNQKIMLEGRLFAIKGTNYFGSWRHPITIRINHDVEFATVWSLYHDWNMEDVEADFRFLRSQLNATAVRIGTPAKSDFSALVRYHGYEPWYGPDGTITDRYKAKLLQLADAAYHNGIRIQFCLLWSIGSEIAANRDGFRPNAAMDQLYSRQVRSIARALWRHAAVIGYSIGNEVLVHWKINGTHTSWYEPIAAGFILRRIRELRAAAPLQLITTDEGAHPGAGWWHSPGPEFALLPDVDGSNGGRAFRLLDHVDYLGAHFYPETLTKKASVKHSETAMIRDALHKIATYLRSATTMGKPVAFGEFGLKLDPWTLSPVQYAAFRDRLFQKVLATAPGLGLQGVLAWLALPEVVLRPGYYQVVLSGPKQSGPVEVDVAGPVGPLRRIVFLQPSFSLFTWGPNGDTPHPTEAAKALAAAWQN